LPSYSQGRGYATTAILILFKAKRGISISKQIAKMPVNSNILGVYAIASKIQRLHGEHEMLLSLSCVHFQHPLYNAPPPSPHPHREPK